MERIFQTVAVEVTLLKSNPPQLAITAIGQVSSGGWKNGTLEPRYYIVPPADGIQDFDFVATPPFFSEAVQVMLPITAYHVIEQIPDWLLGVRIHAKTNNVEAKLSEAKEYLIS